MPCVNRMGIFSMDGKQEKVRPFVSEIISSNADYLKREIKSVVTDTTNQSNFFAATVVDPIGGKLDAHPLIYKVVVFAVHLFNMLSSLALITFLPFSFPVNCLIAVAGSLVSRIAIERNCDFHLAIPDCLGAIALAFSLPYLVNFIALSTFSTFAVASAASTPFAAYLGYTMWSSNAEVNARTAW